MTPKYNYYVTKGISKAISESAEFIRELVEAANRFLNHDWGDLCESDKALNEQALQHAGRILAAYPTSQGRMYIITEDTTAKVWTTTVLFADEY